jgi:ketosteroid isomerase-like protein
MVMDVASAERTPTTEAWVEAFAEGWRAPGGADAFADHFESLLSPDIVLIQPQVPTAVGLHAFRERLARPLFELIPDLHGTVEGWAARGDVIFIQLRLAGTVGGRPFTARTCDRVTLRDGLAIERVTHMDPTPLMRALALSPRVWPRFLRLRLASRARR